MKLFNRAQEPNRTPSLVAKRAARMSTHDIVSWLDSLILSLGQTFDKWSREKADVDDMDMVIETINTLWEELKRRD